MFCTKRIKYFIGTLLLVIPYTLFATHNRGGEITYRHISGLTYEFIITTCTDVGSGVTTDRDELYIDYGDGQGDTISRYDVVNSLLSHQKNYYKGTHTYTSPGTYIICMEDPNRNAGITNIYSGGSGNSDDVVFSLQSKLVINPFSGNFGANSSVYFDDCPCPAIACVNQKYCYNSLAVDPDGDSLSYKLVAPFGDDCSPLPIPAVYQYPHLVAGGTLTIDPVTGTLCWDSPTQIGEFNYTIKISEWRNGTLVGYVIRDVQLTVQGNCTNSPPTFDPLPDVCVTAGDVVNFNVQVTDFEGNLITLTGSGLPLSTTNPATFTDTAQFSSVTGIFNWNTSCENIKVGAYQMLFAATDNGSPQFSDYQSVMIDILPPIITGVTATPFGNGVTINWNPTNCSNAEGYRIYRTTNPNFVFAPCCEKPNPLNYDFEMIGEVFGSSTGTFVDNTSLTLGIEYCYVVTAFYDIGQIESCPSDAACARLKKEVPVLTHVTVVQTDITNGIDSIMWSKPTELDTSQYPGPYFCKIYHGTSINNVSTYVGETLPTDSLYNSDTTFTQMGLNTESMANYYRVDLYYDSLGIAKLVGSSNKGGSVFISTTPNDNQITLSWDENVPWINTDYDVYRATNFSGPYSYIGNTNSQEYTDVDLVNGAEYCYYVESHGHYSSSSIINPIVNLSQITCESPIDLTPPCPPELAIEGDCQVGENTLIWTNPNNFCADDVMSYNLYYTPVQGEQMMLIASFSNDGDTTFTHNNNGSVAGCYTITAMDSVQYGNMSDSSNIVCFDNCPSYWLPNVFTPNGDGNNDFFIPIDPYMYVESVDIQVYNRWGQIIFETTDPDIKWDGKHKDTGTIVPDGVYYYLCTVNTIRLTGIEPIILKGFFHIFSDGLGKGE